jgi:hypothetical protein
MRNAFVLGLLGSCLACSGTDDVASGGPNASGGGSASGGAAGEAFGGVGGEELGGFGGEETGGTGGFEETGGTGGGDVGGSGGEGTGGGGTECPTNGPPKGPANRRFDIATLSCSTGGACTGAEDKCFCQPDFDVLNGVPSHFLGLGTDKQKPNVWAKGNFQAVYVDDLNTNWEAGGAARALNVMATAQQNFPCGVPSWVIVNEISAGLWPSNASYRDYVVAFAKSLHVDHGRTVVIAAPFDGPGANGAWWSQLQEHAFVGAEVYLSGKEVNASGNSVSWCKAQYQSAIKAYAAVGVPKSRLFLFEHFGNSAADKGWGRAGVSVAGWKNAIDARAQAIGQLGFAGFVSYGWGGNEMHAPEEDRLDFAAVYAAGQVP